jgi:hypothetical protein
MTIEIMWTMTTDKTYGGDKARIISDNALQSLHLYLATWI